MPKWVVKCPRCGNTFTHTEIQADIVHQGQRDPYGIVAKPREAMKRACPECKVESLFQPFHLFYSA